MLYECVDFVWYDLLDIGVVSEGLCYLCCIDVELDCCMMVGKYVVLEVWWNVEWECVVVVVEVVIGCVGVDDWGWCELGWKECCCDLCW